MKLSGLVSAAGRRIVVSVGGAAAAALIAGSLVQAQAPAAPAAAAPAQQADSFMFKSQTAMIQWQVKADKAADFESAWQAIRTKALANGKPEIKALGESIRIYKIAADPVQVPNVGPVVTYYFIIDPASTAVSYDPSNLLFGEGMGLFERTEAEPVFNKLKDSIVGIGPQALQKVQ